MRPCWTPTVCRFRTASSARRHLCRSACRSVSRWARATLMISMLRGYAVQVPARGDAKKSRPWKKSLKTEKGKKGTMLNVNAPGEYTITGVKGKFYEEGVLAPENCNVLESNGVQQRLSGRRFMIALGIPACPPRPLHGSLPFQVYYRPPRDNKRARESHKTFPNSRGELTLQPERSGQYAHTFLSMSDSNYQKVELSGPSIN
ncbi:hypothetical protein FIBSPDRAFT_394513 [Athelia psychrophila]|uniref:Nucleoporin POM152 immunoglobulin-like domain-containing protein n=1 Tax=Athelia psychrophila TaxID=1759441 RepID=A0A166NM78_9AGAM|nr:hypothetical protein FIBSPDRAFT_394513 [Fibularhizoctonia sp. CBS 109695]